MHEDVCAAVRYLNENPDAANNAVSASKEVTSDILFWESLLRKENLVTVLRRPAKRISQRDRQSLVILWNVQRVKQVGYRIMQLKRTIKIVYILAVFVLFYLALPPTRVEAQACGGDCSVVKCDNQPRCRIIGRELYCPVAYCSQCGGSGCERVGCPPGEFMANDGCRPIGAVDNCPCGTKPSGVCNSCEEDLPPPEPPAIPTEIPTPTPTLTPTPTPLPVNILVRGVNLPAIPQLCDQIKASTDYRTGSVFDVTKNGTSIGQQTQSGSTYLSWIDTAGTYAVSSAEVASSAVRYCLTDGTGSTFGPSTVVAPAGTTQTFDVSFSPFGPWFQTKAAEMCIAVERSFPKFLPLPCLAYFFLMAVQRAPCFPVFRYTAPQPSCRTTLTNLQAVREKQ